jgi:hypothetical protein
MCIRSDTGAVRVEQQLTGQSIVIPQNGEVAINNGQLDNLRSGVTHCSCELQLAKTLAVPSPQPEVSRLPTAEEMQKANNGLAKNSSAQAKSATQDGPVYQVFMPPLSYDSTAKVQPDTFDPQLIVLVRRARVRPSLIFRGTVKDAPMRAQNPPSTAPAQQPATPPSQALRPAQKNPPAPESAIGRIRSFLRRLLS